MVSMMTLSAVWSASLTKSLCPYILTRAFILSSLLRLRINVSPARWAAMTATFSNACILLFRNIMKELLLYRSTLSFKQDRITDLIVTNKKN